MGIRDADRWLAGGRVQCVVYNSIGELHFVREVSVGCFRAGSVRGALVLECCVLRVVECCVLRVVEC